MKRLSMIILVCILSSLVLSACGTNTNSGAARKDLILWGSWSGSQVDQLNQQLAKYNSSQDKYTAKYVVQDGLEEKLLTAIAGGELPDVILWDRYNTSVYASKGALQPLDEFISKDGVDMSQFYAPSVDEMTYDGKIYGVPLLVDARILFYNKTLLSEAGIDPASITNWSSLEEAAVKLTKRDSSGKLEQAGLSLKDQGLFSIWDAQAGGKLVNDTNPPTTAFNSPQGLSVLDFWNKLLNQDKVYDIGFDDAFSGNGFKAGKVAITYDGPWSLADYKAANIDFGVIEPPVGPNGDKGAFMGGFGLVLPNKGKNLDAGWDFIKWWTMQPQNGVDFAKISGWIPANIAAGQDPYFTNDPNYGVFIKTMSYANIRPKAFGYSDVEGLALIPQLQKFVAGEISAEEALNVAQEQGDAIFKDYSSK